MSDTKQNSEEVADNSVIDDTIDEESTVKEIKRRRRLSPDETRILAEIFEQTQKPNAALRNRLAQQLDMSSRAVQIWFQNRRAKIKRDASEAQNNYFFDRDRRLSLHLYERDNANYYMDNGVPRRASYSVGYNNNGYNNQGYPTMMNGSNNYPTPAMNPYPHQPQNNTTAPMNPYPPQPQTNSNPTQMNQYAPPSQTNSSYSQPQTNSTTPTQMNHYSQQNNISYTTALQPPPQQQPQQNGIAYHQNQNMYSPMGPQAVSSTTQIPNDQLLINSSAGLTTMNSLPNNASVTPTTTNYTTTTNQPMYIQYSSQNNHQQSQPQQQRMVSPINYPQTTTTTAPLQQHHQQTSNYITNNGGIIDQNTSNSTNSTTNSNTSANNISSSSSSTSSSTSNNTSNYTYQDDSRNSSIYSQQQQQNQASTQQQLPSLQNFQIRNLPSPPPMNNKSKVPSTYGYINSTTSPTSNGTQQQSNNGSPHYITNSTYQSYQSNLGGAGNGNDCINTPQNMYSKEPLSPVSKDSSCGNTTPVNWANNVVGSNGMTNDTLMNININNSSTPQSSYPNTTTSPMNQNNNNTFATHPNNSTTTNNSCYYIYSNQKPMNNGVCNSYISPIES